MEEKLYEIHHHLEEIKVSGIDVMHMAAALDGIEGLILEIEKAKKEHENSEDEDKKEDKVS